MITLAINKFRGINSLTILMNYLIKYKKKKEWDKINSSGPSKLSPVFIKFVKVVLNLISKTFRVADTPIKPDKSIWEKERKKTNV